MKRILILAAMICGLSVSAGAENMPAQPINIATGKAGGGYDRRAQQIEQRLEQRGIVATTRNLNGSDEISLAVCAGRADLGIMQIDAIYARSQEGCTVKPIAVYGVEYAVFLIPPRANISKLSHLTAADAVLVDTIGSGSDLFWRTIVRIETGEDGTGDEWAQARVINDPLELAQAAAEMGDISAVVLVRKPDSPDITRLLDLGWTLGEMWDRDIDDLQFNGAPLYASEKVSVVWGNRKARAYAYQIRSLIAANTRIASGDRTTFAAITSAAQ